MNARSQVIELAVEGTQIEEVVQGLFHTILLHRTNGKHVYNEEKNYKNLAIGPLMPVDVDCDFVDFSFMKINNKDLDAYLNKEVSQFKDMLRSNDNQQSGQIFLEFYRKQKSRWLFQADISPWEVWSIKLDVVHTNSQNESIEFKAKLSDQLTEKVFNIIDIINRHEYVPSIPLKEEEDTVFDTSYTDIQPYLFRIYHQTSGPSPTSVGTTMRKFLRGSLAL